jgi:septum site-determining protein MinD
MTKNGDMLDVADIIETLSVKLLGIVPDDKNITISTNRGEPIVLDEDAFAGQAFKNIARRITGEEVPLMNLNVEDHQGFFSSLKKLFKRN